MNLRRILRVVLVVVCLVAYLPSPTSVAAYATGPIPQPQQNFPVVQYSIDPNLGQLLNGLSQASVVAAIHAASSQWSQPTPLTLQDEGAWMPNDPNAISAASFDNPQPWGPGLCSIGALSYAAHCDLANGRILFNNSGNFQWNTIGIHNGVPRPILADVQTTIIHEFGHTLSPDHDCRDFEHNPDVMCFQGNSAQQTLYEDDKRGMVQLYGPLTSWEESSFQANSISNEFALWSIFDPAHQVRKDDAGYDFGTDGPEQQPLLGPVTGTQVIQRPEYHEVSPQSGSRMLRFSGYAKTTESYTYMALFSGVKDQNIASTHYVTIVPGMHLRWKQYNSAQETIGLDIQFADDTWMRDKCEEYTTECLQYTDNFGGYIHPARRDTRRFDSAHISTERLGWNQYDIDLSPFHDQLIQQIVVAYDNGRTHTTGIFRAYFDDLALLVPGGQATILTAWSGNGSVAVSPQGSSFPIGTTVTLTPQPQPGNIFRYWVIDGVAGSWPTGPVTLTLKTNHTATAYFLPVSSFTDTGGSPYAVAIGQIAARLIARGYTDSACQQRGLSPPCFGPNDGVLRAQMAAFIARGIADWDVENWGNTFSDGGGIAADLWRNVGTLQHYGVASGYDSATCAARGVASPCFGPNDPVTNAQTITFITRAMVKRGNWTPQPGQAIPYTGVPSVHLDDLKTYYFYTQDRGGVPDAGSWGSTQWNANANRGWFAESEWRALDDYYVQPETTQSEVVGTNTFSDWFATKNTSAWSWSTYQTVPFTVDGRSTVKSVGSGTGYQSTFGRTSTLTSRKVVEFRFKVTSANTLAHFSIEDSAGRRFGVIADGGRLYPQYNDGAGFVYPANSDLFTNLQVNTWYVLRLSIDDVNGFRAWAWPEFHPHQIGSYQRKMTAGRAWHFQHWIYRDTAYIDDYREFTP